MERKTLSLVAALAVSATFLAAPEVAAAQSRGGAAYASRTPLHHSMREISDQDHARLRRERGQILPFEDLMRTAAPIGRGKYLGVEPDISSGVYRFKFMRTSGNVVWVDVDGHTGHVLAERR